MRLIEFDGIQHYSDRSGVWNREDSLERRQERDNRKNKWAFENNISLVRISYWELDKITLEMILDPTYKVQKANQAIHKFDDGDSGQGTLLLYPLMKGEK